MSPPNDFPTLSDGAIELLRIARENDEHRAMARNASLLKALTFTERLIQACRGDWRKSLPTLFAVETLPPAFLGFVYQSLRTIQREVDELFSRPPSEYNLPVVTDFNVHALQAEAHLLADFAWPSRSAADFDGPPLAEVVERMRSVEIQRAWKTLLQHYIGNILQDVFAAARIREAVPDLDPEAEVLLRSRDAYELSQYVLATYAASQPEAPHPVDLMLALDQALDEVIE